MWRFSIIGDIGPLVYHVEHPTSGKEFHAGFPTKMGGKASVFQSYQLVLNPTKKAQEWIATDSFTSSDGIIAEERFALANLYFATNGEGWKDQDKWMTAGKNHCEWEGVWCNNSDGYVDQLLGLDGNKLTGPIPECIGDLVNLYSLFLDVNELTGGPIPESIGDLVVNLQQLSLSLNQFTGPIPDSIGNLVNLESLDLGLNQLTGPIPEAIGNLVNLRGLYLDGNELTGPIPKSILNMVNLRYLYLNSNQLDPTPEWLKKFCESRTTLDCYF